MAGVENIPDLPGKLAEKLPTVEQWKKNGNSSVSFVFMLIFVIYFLWSEFGRENSCAGQIATLELALKEKDKYINQLNERVVKLEKFIDIKSGVIKKVEDTVGPVQVGGSD